MTTWKDRLPPATAASVEEFVARGWYGDFDQKRYERMCAVIGESVLGNMAARLALYLRREDYGIPKELLDSVLPPDDYQTSTQPLGPTTSTSRSESLSDYDQDLVGPLFQLTNQLYHEHLEIRAVKSGPGSQYPRTVCKIPERVIGFLAVTILETCVYGRKQPPALLLPLIKELLDIRAFGRSSEREPYRWKLAAFLKAQDRDLSASQLARQIGIGRQTVSRWYNERDFQSLTHYLRTKPGAMETWRHHFDQGTDFPDPPWSTRKAVRYTPS